jgi:hypothetical protein
MANPLAGLQAWAGKNKGLAAAAGIGGLAGGVMLIRRKNATSTSNPSVTASPAGSTPAYGQAGYYDSTATDLYNAITPQLQGLQAQIAAAGLGAGTSGGAVTAVPADKPDLPGYPGSGQLWSTFQAQQVSSGAFVGKPGYEDWGVIAGNVLGPSASRLDVLTEAQKLQGLNPGVVASQAPGGYVPTSALSGLRTS